MEKIPARIVAKIHHNPSVNPRYSWFYTVDAYSLPYTVGDEPAGIDFGSVESRERACEIVAYILSHRDEFDMDEFVHVPQSRRMRKYGRKVEVTTMTYAIEVEDSDHETAAEMQNAVVELLTGNGFSVTRIVPQTVRP